MNPRDPDPTDPTPKQPTPGDPLAGAEQPTPAEPPAAEQPPPGEPPQAEQPPPAEPPGAEAPPIGAQAPAGGGTPPTGTPPSPRRFTRPRGDRVLGGVCSGLARYLGVDVVLVRVAAVALVFAGGAGVILYLAALLLAPGDDDPGPAPPAADRRAVTVAAAVALVIAAAVVGPFSGFAFGLALLLGLLGVAGLAVWWLASGRRPEGDAARIAAAAALGVALLGLCGVLAVLGAWTGATAGETVVIAAALAGAATLAAAVALRPARLLALPVAAFVAPLVTVAAIGIDVEGGIGEREYRPQSPAAVRDSYRIGVGHLVVDLREADLPPGERRLRIDVGAGEALLLVPDDACVTGNAEVGVGEVESLTAQQDTTAGATRVVVDADVGVGEFHVRRHRYGLEREATACADAA